MLKHYFPGSAASLDAALASSLAAIPDGQARQDGIGVGAAAAAAMIALRANDGSAPPQFHLPASADPGEWQTTPSCPPSGGVFVHWRNVTPFGIESSDQFRSDPPPALDSRKMPRETTTRSKIVGGIASTERPANRAEVARFYAAVLALVAWNPAVRQVAAAQGTSLVENARAFALLNMAINDGLVAVMETKYHYSFWRPETAVVRGLEDGNPKTDADSAFAPFVVTPCFPSYPSAHASASYAAASIAEGFWATVVFPSCSRAPLFQASPSTTRASRKSPTISTTRASTVGSTSASIRSWRAPGAPGRRIHLPTLSSTLRSPEK